MLSARGHSTTQRNRSRCDDLLLDDVARVDAPTGVFVDGQLVVGSGEDAGATFRSIPPPAGVSSLTSNQSHGPARISL